MTNEITDTERAQLESLQSRMESRQAGNKATTAGLAEKKKQADADEKVYKKQWDFYHQIIVYYEKEIERMNGEFIAAPFTEADVVTQAQEKGRLYQAPNSQDPRTIPEMVGEGLSPTLRPERETKITTDILEIINILLTGKGPNSGSGTTLKTSYTVGDPQLTLVGPVNAGWHIINGRSFVRLSSAAEIDTGTCSDPQFLTEEACTTAMEIWTPGPPEYVCSVLETLPFPNPVEDAGAGSSVEPFNGFSNSERASKTAAAQGFMDYMVATLQYYILSWKTQVTDEVSFQTKNEDENMDQNAVTANQTLLTYLNSYITGGYPIQDGPSGIGGLQAKTTDRASYIPTRVGAAKTAKAMYYSQRIEFTKLRCNIQSGTLTRVKFLEVLQADFPPSGNPEVTKQLKAIKGLLEK